MPKINSPVKSKAQQQQLRRMRERETDFISKFKNHNITCCSFERLLRASEAEITALIPLLKKIIQHNQKVNVLIADKCFTPDKIITNECNEPLLEYLQIQYKGHKGKTLKYKNSDRKDRFRETILIENQLQFNNCLSIETENSIKKFYDNIDISDYVITDTYLKNEAKERELKDVWINTKEIEPEIIICEPEDPPKPIKTPMKPTKKKATKKIKKETKVEIITQPIRQQPPPEYESDSDIEADVAELELRENTDQDNITDDDIKKWKKTLGKLWKDDLADQFGMIDEYDNQAEYNKNITHKEFQSRALEWMTTKHEEEIPQLINTFMMRSVNQLRGSKAYIGKWSSKNPVSLKKVIVSIVKKASKSALKKL